ncbi:Hypothetical protein R9X50_00706000 [Acrodontium crateriforme]|uniref:Alpha/beta hydrolase fold-3 domain-containing protein n=1 Tax=Acrodontium crateriforme TaxID=150365 RepID=A0AAQ3MDP1_9PEZI|nr:Hypothetical protein R9X50_00706000 [Acrodontium crateriforme]
MNAAVKPLAGDTPVTIKHPSPHKSPKFAAFDIVDVDYKKVNNTPIPASILIPKTIRPGTHPVIIHWHGGALITGHRIYPDWYPTWILEFSQKHNAIIINPDHRLLPEANGLEILEDVKDFFAWLFQTQSPLYSLLPEGVSVDLDHLLVDGESAGGWLAVQSALLHPGQISAVIAHYPMLDLRDGHYTKRYEKKLFDPPAPTVNESVLRDFVGNLSGDEIVTSAVPPERLLLVLSVLQQGRTMEFLGSERELYPIEMLDEAATKLPPVWVLHGKQDSVVPAVGTERFAAALREKYPGAKLHVSLQEGEHGFDNHAPVTNEAASLKTDWVQKGVEFIEQFWPVTV